MAERSGEIALDNGHKFKWMLTGTTHPEIYGMIERPDGRLIAEACGWYRTDDAEKACRIATDTYAKEMKEIENANP